MRNISNCNLDKSHYFSVHYLNSILIDQQVLTFFHQCWKYFITTFVYFLNYLKQITRIRIIDEAILLFLVNRLNRGKNGKKYQILFRVFVLRVAWGVAPIGWKCLNNFYVNPNAYWAWLTFLPIKFSKIMLINY